MSVEIVYYNTSANDEIEERLSRFGELHTSSGEDRRQFLTALASAVSASDTVVAVGEISSLVAVLSKGLGLPLEAVDWAKLGLDGESDVMLPHGALPLVIENGVYGMIVESAAQCIIAIDNEPGASLLLVDNYVVPYIEAVTQMRQAQPVPVEEAPVEEELAEEAPVEEAPVEEAPVEEAPIEEALVEEIPVEETPAEDIPEEQTDTPEDEVDIFADIDESDFLDIEPERKKHGILIAFICILAILIIGGVCGYFGFTKLWQPKKNDDVLKDALAAYKDTAQSSVSGMPADYSLKFGSLYEMNSDVIAWLKADGLGISTPVVTGALHSEGYYKNHIFDGTVNPFGTPYTEYAYDTTVNVNPNLVIYGNNTGDGRAFSNLEKLLTADGLKKVKTLTTDSVLYGKEDWRIISVMLVSADGKEYNYKDNFRMLSPEERSAAVKKAIERSKVATGVKPEQFDDIDYTDGFLTLVTPYSKDSGKMVVVVACHTVSEKQDEPEKSVEEPVESQPEVTSDVSSDMSSIPEVQQ